MVRSYSAELLGILAIALLVVWKIYASSLPRQKTRTTLASAGLPHPDPLTDFNLRTATTRNHIYVNKTLRSPYFQTMAHQPCHINDWIEIDKDYEWYLSEKKRVIEEQGVNVLDSLPENDAACNELLCLLSDYLPRRFPTLFSAIECRGYGIFNKVTNEKFVDVESTSGVEALRVISRLVQGDFLMGKERADGQVYFTGGLVAFPGFYLLSKKINRCLREVHEPVPYFNENILKSVERTLKRFKSHEPFERTSWEIVDDRNLFFHGIARLHGGAELPKEIEAKDLFFRVDHQTFFKMPKSGGMIFGVHPIMKRLEDLADSPLVPALLATIHNESDEKLMNYKVAPAYQERMMVYLEELNAAQIKSGLITGTEKVAEFRELVKGELPSTMTSLQHPTESEIRLENSRL